MINKINNNDDSKIDEIKDFLYSRSTGDIKQKRSILKKSKVKNISKQWSVNSLPEQKESEEDLYKYKTKKKNLVFYVILFLSLTFFVASLAFTFFFLTFNKNEISLSEINVSILGPNSVKSGEELPFSVIIENPSDIEYENIEMTVYYPKSTIKSSDKEFINADTKEIKENLLPGGKITQKFNVILSGSVGEKKEIKIDIFYKGKNYSGVLNKKVNYTVEVDSSPVNIELKYPKKVISGDEFTLKVNVLSNITSPISDLIVIGRYPVGFNVISTKPKYILSDTTKNIFKIDQINPGEQKEIEIKGYIKGEMDEEKYFTFTIGDTVPFRNELRTIFSKSEDYLTIKKPDIGLKLVTENDIDHKTANYFAGNKVKINLSLNNNLQNIISDIKIISEIDGIIFKKEKFNVNKGFWDSNRNRVIWDKTINDSFKSLKGGGFIKDDISFEVNDLEELAGYVKDPKVSLNFKVYANNFSDPNSETQVFSEFDKEIKIGTNIKFLEKILFNDGPFENKGSANPVVGKPTVYTVAWEIYNSTSDVSDVKVVAKLPAYVKYLGNTSPKNAYISYNEHTREVSLNYKKIKAFIGYRTDPKTVYFQIEYIPTSPHTGSKPVLVGSKKIYAQDDFIKKSIYETSQASTTDIKFDSKYSYGIGTVEDK